MPPGSASRATREILHYLSVPPSAAAAVVEMINKAGLAEGAKVVLEKPFGTDLESARKLNDIVHRAFDEDQIYRIDHFLGKEAALNILALRFANGLFEPIWNRNHIDHVQIEVPEELGLEQAGLLLRADGRLSRHGRHPPVPGARLCGHGAADGTRRRSRSASRRTRSSGRCARSSRTTSSAGSTRAIAPNRGSPPTRETETFVALRCDIDNWRWSGVPFYLRTGKRLAEGARIISIAFREPPKSMFPDTAPASATTGPDHLTFDLDEASSLSLSFYGKRPGPGMMLDKLSMQFSIAEIRTYGDVLEAYERLIWDAIAATNAVHDRRGHRAPVGGRDPAARAPAAGAPYAQGSWGPKEINDVIAPHRWRLPFERPWREAKGHGFRRGGGDGGRRSLIGGR